MSIPGEEIAPPRTGEWDVPRLATYPNSRVRELIGHLQKQFGYLRIDSFTGEYISLLCQYVVRMPTGAYDFARLRYGANGSNQITLVEWLRYQRGQAPAPWQCLYIETRREAARRARPGAMRVDGSYLFGLADQGPGTMDDATRQMQRRSLAR